ncbi:MAG: hypothetical protein ACPGQS_15495, partial [Bradymonadia bacterium]
MPVNFTSLCGPYEPDESRFLSFHDGEYYFAARSSTEGTLIQLSVSAGRQVEVRLAEDVQQWLYDQGFRRKRASQDFSLRVPKEKFDNGVAMSLLAGFFSEQLGRSVPEGTLLCLPSIQIDNQRVYEAMTHLANNRDWAARKTLYRLMIDAWFVQPINDLGEIEIEDKMGTWPVCAVFLDEESFVQRYPCGNRYRIVQGWELFPS